MLSIVCVALMLALGVTVLIVEQRAATPVTDEPRRQIAIALAILGLLAVVAFSPWFTWLGANTLPVEPPPEPWKDGSGSCGGSGGGPPLWILVVFYLVLRAGPAPWMAIATGPKARATTRIPTGHRALRIATWTFAITAAVVTVRMLVGGAAPSAFTTYGATTPEHAPGWRADLYLATLGTRYAIPEEGTLADEFEHHEGSDCCGALAHPPFDTAHEGLMAWVDDRPVVIYRDGTRVVGAYVASRDSMVPHERRAHFAAWPEVARLDDETLLVIGKGADGSLLAVKVSDRYLNAEPADDGEAWIFIAPPKLPFFVAILFGVAALALVRTGREYGWARLLAAWALLEGTVILVYAYARFVV